MAGPASLSARPAFRFAAVVAVVLAAHQVAVRWFSDKLDAPHPVQQMAMPMLTRVLRQEVAPPPPAAAPVATAAVRRRPRPGSIETALAAKPKPPASAAQPAEAPASEPAPTPVPEAVAIAPAEAAVPSPPASAATGATAASAASAASATIAAAPPASSPASAPASTTAAQLDTWPADTRLNYRLTGWYRGEVYGSARVKWQRQDERYQARIEIDLPFVALSLTSQGVVAGDNLSPGVFEERTNSRLRTVRIAEDGLTLNDGRKLPRPPAVQDTASQFVELSHRFSTGREKLQVGNAVVVWLARPGGLDEWTYDIVGREMLASAELGNIDTFHLKPRPLANPRGNITAEMWFAPSLQYLPVRIRINMGTDTWVDLMVEKIEQR